MKLSKRSAKAYAQDNLRGIWAATMTPFSVDLTEVNFSGFRQNVAFFADQLQIAGLFVGGKQGEFFSLSVEERKQLCEAAVAEATSNGRSCGIMASVSDQNLDCVLDLAAHAESAGADYIVVHSPKLHFADNIDKLVYEYYSYVASHVDIGVTMWSHPDAGYLMSPELCAKIAREVPNVVAIKYSVPRKQYIQLTEIASDYLIVSNPSETDWLDNIIDLGWQVYLCSVPPYLIQTPDDLRMSKYTELARAGKVQEAKRVRDSLEPVRAALASSRLGGTPQAGQKYWQELLGQIGGPVRRPLLNLAPDEKVQIAEAFSISGIGEAASGSAQA